MALKKQMLFYPGFYLISQVQNLARVRSPAQNLLVGMVPDTTGFVPDSILYKLKKSVDAYCKSTLSN